MGHQVYLSLFADDIVLFTTDPVSLQAQINNLVNYSDAWGLKININKTKICVFEKRKRLNNVEFYIYNEKIEIVDNFTYLGVRFTHTGNLSNAVKTLSDQALRAYYNLLSLFDKVEIDIRTKLKLFDTMIVPILLYGSEVWGVYNFKEVDKLHIRFCKNLLGVRQQTPNMAVYGELGRLPLSVIAKSRSIKFWLKIKNNANSPISSLYMDQCANINSNCWASNMNSIIDHLGFSQLLNNYDINCNYMPLLKTRLYDQFKQEWSTCVNSMSKLDYYVRFKTSFCYEEYIDKFTNDSLRKHFSRLRLCSHSLEIEFGRFNGIDRENRLCKLCNQNTIESEYHFLLCCSKYNDIRIKYLGYISWPTIQKFNSYMSTKKRNNLIKISKFIKEAFAIRKTALENLTVS